LILPRFDVRLLDLDFTVEIHIVSTDSGVDPIDDYPEFPVMRLQWFVGDREILRVGE
jgi:hypothetical protein